MPRPQGAPDRANLTNRLVRRDLPPATSGQYIVRDETLPGFFVVVGTRVDRDRPGLGRTYTIQTDVRELGHRRTIRKAIGWADEWDAQDARKEGKRLLGELQTGAKRVHRRTGALTLGEAWEQYCTRLERRGSSPRTIEGYRDSIERLLGPWLDKPLRDIGEHVEWVARRHRKITKKHGPYAANHAMRALRAVYNNARKKKLDPGLPADNPVDAVEFNPESRRDTGMGRADLAKWHRQVRALPNPVRREFHLFTLLSASRPDALRRARWEHLDVAGRTLHFPDPKGGAAKAFDMPLSRAMLRCLWRARKAGRMLHGAQAETFIFPADTPTGYIAETKEKRDPAEAERRRQLRGEDPKDVDEFDPEELLGKVLNFWGGDLRQTYRNMAHEVGLGEMDVHLLMNHSLGGVNAGYLTKGALRDHLVAQQEKVSRHIMAALDEAGE